MTDKIKKSSETAEFPFGFELTSMPIIFFKQFEEILFGHEGCKEDNEKHALDIINQNEGGRIAFKIISCEAFDIYLCPLFKQEMFEENKKQAFFVYYQTINTLKRRCPECFSYSQIYNLFNCLFALIKREILSNKYNITNKAPNVYTETQNKPH
jgi:hypothetical protein